MNITEGTTYLYCCITNRFSVSIDVSGASANIAESPLSFFLSRYFDNKTKSDHDFQSVINVSILLVKISSLNTKYQHENVWPLSLALRRAQVLTYPPSALKKLVNFYPYIFFSLLAALNGSHTHLHSSTLKPLHPNPFP